jgi:hypothetical protein
LCQITHSLACTHHWCVLWTACRFGTRFGRLSCLVCNASACWLVTLRTIHTQPTPKGVSLTGICCPLLLFPCLSLLRSPHGIVVALGWTIAHMLSRTPAACPSARQRTCWPSWRAPVHAPVHALGYTCHGGEPCTRLLSRPCSGLRAQCTVSCSVVLNPRPHTHRCNWLALADVVGAHLLTGSAHACQCDWCLPIFTLVYTPVDAMDQAPGHPRSDTLDCVSVDCIHWARTHASVGPIRVHFNALGTCAWCHRRLYSTRATSYEHSKNTTCAEADLCPKPEVNRSLTMYR